MFDWLYKWICQNKTAVWKKHILIVLNEKAVITKAHITANSIDLLFADNIESLFINGVTFDSSVYIDSGKFVGISNSDIPTPTAIRKNE